MVINVVGLAISIPEFIWTIINFFLLLFLLNQFLYKPVLKFMDERQARIDAGLAQGKEAEKAMTESKAGFAEELAQSGAEAREKISAARGKAEQAKSERLNAAHAEAADIHNDVYRRIEGEEAEAKKSVEDSMPELVAILSQQLLHSDEAGQNGELIASCINAAKE